MKDKKPTSKTPRSSSVEQGYISNLTGEKGQHAACDLFLDWGWLPRPVNTLDQGVDLHVEIGHGGIGQGYHFHVSAKGYNGRGAGGGVTIKRTSANYVLRQREPVFLTYAKLRERTILWIDLKAACAAAPTPGAVRIKLPRDQCLHLDADEQTIEREREAFLQAIEKASRAWRIRRFDEIPGQLAAQEIALSELDPRCSVRVLASSEGMTYEVSAHEPIELQGTIAVPIGPESDKLREAIDYGLPREIAIESFQLRGSALFEELMPTTVKGKLTVAARPSAMVRVTLSPPSGKPQISMSGPLVKGMRGGAVTAASESHPLSLQLILDSQQNHTRLTIDTSVAGWEGKRLLAMTHLRETAETLQAIAESGLLGLELRSGATRSGVDTKRIKEDLTATMRQAAANLRFLEDLRVIATLYACDLRLGRAETWSVEEMFWWNVGRRVLEDQIVDVEIQRLALTMTVEATTAEISSGQTGDFILVAPLQVHAFGHQVCSIPVDVYMKGYVVSIARSGEDQIEIVLTRGDASVMRLRRSSASDFSSLIAE